MSLRDWLEAKWIREHASSRKEIAKFLAAVDRDLGQCQLLTSADWKLAIAHNAILAIAAAALAASGFRVERERHHELTISSLAFTLGVDETMILTLHMYRTKRNIANYEEAGRVTDNEANDILEIAYSLRKKLIAWLSVNHPELMKE